MGDVSDEELVGLIRAGDPEAFAALYGRYREWVLRLAYRFTRNEADAQDVLQETFSYVLRKAPNLKLAAAMTTFLYPAVKNLSIAACEKRRRFAGDEGALAEMAVGGGGLEMESELAVVLENLGEERREVVLMRFVEGFSLEEIAEALSIPVGTVKSRLHHAMAFLRTDKRTRRYFDQGPESA